MPKYLVKYRVHTLGRKKLRRPLLRQRTLTAKSKSVAVARFSNALFKMGHHVRTFVSANLVRKKR